MCTCNYVRNPAWLWRRLATSITAAIGPLLFATGPSTTTADFNAGVPFVHFFLDASSVDHVEGVHRVLEHPVKDPRPLLADDRPWEAGGRNLNSVIFDPAAQIFRMWYSASCPATVARSPGAQPAEASEREPAAQRNFECYAESRDGVNWTRPNLGIVPFQGTGENNIVADVTDKGETLMAVVMDPDDPARRFKAVGYAETGQSILANVKMPTRGLTMSYSADGLHWSQDATLVMTGKDLTDCNTVLPVRDPATGKWTGFFRPRTHPKRRYIGYSESDDFVHWSYPRMLLTPAGADSEFLEFYGTAITLVAGYRVGAVWSFFNDPGWSWLSNELVYSDDGVRYHRAMPRQAWIPAGRSNAFDSVSVIPRSLIEHGDEIWIYYAGNNHTHGSDRTPTQQMTPVETVNHERGRNEIGLARLPWAHFVGYRADGDGTVETKWLTDYDPAAAVKAWATLDHHGAIEAEILDVYGRPIAGWTRKESHFVVDPNDHNALAFYWGSRDLVGRAEQRSSAGGVVGHVVKLRFYLRQGTIYGFALDRHAAMPAFK